MIVAITDTAVSQIITVVWLTTPIPLTGITKTCTCIRPLARQQSYELFAKVQTKQNHLLYCLLVV